MTKFTFAAKTKIKMIPDISRLYKNYDWNKMAD